jgi:glycosyltransferase involved in cell wall biosynthesis
MFVLFRCRETPVTRFLMVCSTLYSNARPELSVVVLCYRSGAPIKQLIERIHHCFEKEAITDYELVLVANYLENSNDATPAIVIGMAQTDPRVRCIAQPKKGMMGWDMKSGLSLARGAYICVIDGDGQILVEDIPKVFRCIKDKKYDLVITYRVKRGDNHWRKTVSVVYNMLFHCFFPGVPVRDVNSKPKIFTREAYEKMDLRSNDWFIDAEIMIQARRYHFAIGELPTVFLGLTGRRSFVHPSAIFEFIKNFIIYRTKEYFIK